MGDFPIPLLPKKEDDVVESLDMPPGFRFHPTDLEIILSYLLEKVMDSSFTSVAISDIDINTCEPWDLPRRANMGEKEWWFFWHRGRKYPTGTRTNRATEKGYWKATGKDKEIFKGKGCLVGMKKTLVFYLGRAPKGKKTNWVMHEYRLEGKSLQTHFSPRSTTTSTSKNDWVVCRVFHKNEPKKDTEGHDGSTSRISPNATFDANPFMYSPSTLPPLSDSSPLYTNNSVPSSDNIWMPMTPAYPTTGPLYLDIPTTNPDSTRYPGSIIPPAGQFPPFTTQEGLGYVHQDQVIQASSNPFKGSCKVEILPPSCSHETGPTIDDGSWDDAAGSPSVGPLADLEDYMWK